MEQIDLLRYALGVLERLGLPHMVLGSMASMAYGEPRILAKMWCYQEGEHEKHLRDIASMLLISGDEIDRPYVEHWATRLDLLEIWQAVLARVGEQRESFSRSSKTRTVDAPKGAVFARNVAGATAALDSDMMPSRESTCSLRWLFGPGR